MGLDVVACATCRAAESLVGAAQTGGRIRSHVTIHALKLGLMHRFSPTCTIDAWQALPRSLQLQ